MKRKRFWLFVYDKYYPSGGMTDYITSSNDWAELCPLLKDADEDTIADIWDSEDESHVCMFREGLWGSDFATRLKRKFQT